jgi:hypothetical protein
MNRRLAALLAPLAFVALADGAIARAADAGLPAALYPSDTRLTYQSRVSNAEMDLDWGFVGVGYVGHNGLQLQPSAISLFHVHTQDDLHRIGGWSQIGVSMRGHHFAEFALFASQYSTASATVGGLWSRQAMLDLQLAAWLHAYRPLAHVPSLLPAGASGRVLALHRRYGHSSVLLVGYQNGAQEVEGMVCTDLGWADRQVLWRDLVRQVRAAGTEVT